MLGVAGEDRLDDLAGGVARQRFVPELHDRRHLVVGEGLGTEGRELVGRGVDSRVQDHDRLHLLAEGRMVDTVDRHLGDRRMLLEALLDLARVHVLPAPQDEVPQPGGQVEASAGHATEVAGAQPAARQERRLVRRRVVPVAEHDQRAPDADLAVLPVGQVTALVIDDPHLDRGEWTTDAVGCIPEHVVGGVADEAARFGEPVAGAEGAD